MLITDWIKNETCKTYVPDSGEYKSDLGGVWVAYLTLGLITFICLLSLFLYQIKTLALECDPSVRYYIVWILSIFPVMTLVSIIGFVEPRAWVVCTTTKLMYLMIGISKFVDLTVQLYGGEPKMLETLKNTNFRFDVMPIFCLFKCLPRPPVSKKALRWILFGCYQLPFVQASYYFILMIVTSFGYHGLGSISPSESYIWLTFYRIISTLIGVYSLNIISTISKGHLEKYNYKKKSLTVRILIIITVMQSTVFDILTYYNVFPCHPPISHKVYGTMIESFVYILEMFVFGVYSFLQYRPSEFVHQKSEKFVQKTEHTLRV